MLTLDRTQFMRLRYRFGSLGAKRRLAVQTGDQLIMEQVVRDGDIFNLTGLIANPNAPGEILTAVAELKHPDLTRFLLDRDDLPQKAREAAAWSVHSSEFSRVLSHPQTGEPELWILMRRATQEQSAHSYLPVMILEHPKASPALFKHALKSLDPSNPSQKDAIFRISSNPRVELKALESCAVVALNRDRLLTEIKPLDSVSVVALNHVFLSSNDWRTTLGEYLQQLELIRQHPSCDLILTLIKDGYKGNAEGLLKTAEALDS